MMYDISSSLLCNRRAHLKGVVICHVNAHIRALQVAMPLCLCVTLKSRRFNLDRERCEGATETHTSCSSVC